MAFLNRCIWTPAGSGLADFVVASAAENGYMPAQCLDPAVSNGGTYHYFATQGTDHEEGDGVYTVSTSTLTRTTIRNSSNAGAKVNFSAPPLIFMGGPIATDLLSILRLTANTIFHVATTGNDSTGDGSAGSPWATFQHAVDYISQNIDYRGFNITLQFADGSYPGAVTVGMLNTGSVRPTLFIQGNASDHTAVKFTNSLAVSGIICRVNSPGVLVLFKQITFDKGATPDQLVALQTFSRVQFGDATGTTVGFRGPVGGGSGGDMTIAEAGGDIYVNDNIHIFGGAWDFALRTIGGTIAVSDECDHLLTYDAGGSVTYFAAAANDVAAPSTIVIVGGFTTAGTPSGYSKFLIGANGIIDVTLIGGDLNVFPGSNPGVVTGTGVYNYTGGVLSLHSTGGVTVANLPSASQQGAGATNFVIDSNATLAGNIVAAGGSNKVPVYSDGTNWIIEAGDSHTATSNFTFYVATTGSDSNPGTIGSPFATIQHAVDVAAGYNYQGLYHPSILVADGTYNEDVNLPPLLQVPIPDGNYPPANVTGNPAARTNVVVSSFNCGTRASWTVDGFQVTSTSLSMISSQWFGILQANNIDIAGSGAGASAFGLGPYGWILTGDVTVSSTALSSLSGAFNNTTMVFGGASGNLTFNADIAFTDAIISGAGFVVFDAAIVTNGHAITGNKFNLDGPESWIIFPGNTVDGVQCNRATFPGTSIGIISETIAHPIYSDVAYKVDAPSTGATITMSPGQKSEILNPSGTLAALTINLPTWMADGETTTISSTHIITALTVAATDGSSIAGAPTALTAGQAFTMIYDLGTTTWYPIAGAGSGGRIVLTADADYYIDNTTGSDSNPGTSALPFATGSGAWTILTAKLDLAAYTLNLHLAASATPYSFGIGNGFVGGLGVNIIGAGSSTTSMNIGADAGRQIIAPNINIDYVKFDGGSSGTPIYWGCNGTITIGGVDVAFAPTTGQHIFQYNSDIDFFGAVTVDGSLNPDAFSASYVGSLLQFFGSITFTGTPSFGTACVISSGGARVNGGGTFIGTATGKRFDVNHDGVIDVGGDPNYFPGDVAGTRSSGGIYIGIAETRELLTADRTYYVRTGGNDAHTGLVNNDANAKLTFNGAYAAVCGLIDFGGHVVTIQMQNATYTDQCSLDKVWTGGGALIFDGGGGTINWSGEDGALQISQPLPGAFTFQNVTLVGAGNYGLAIFATSKVENGPGVIFGACVDAHIMLASVGAFLYMPEDYTISGGAGVHINAQFQSAVFIGAGTITITGTPNFASSFLSAISLSSISLNGQTFSGAATGKQWASDRLSMVSAAGATIPGDVAGGPPTNGAIFTA